MDETTLDLTQGQSSLYWEKYKLFFLNLPVTIGVQRHARETCTLEQALESRILFCPFNKRCSDGFVQHDKLWSADHMILNKIYTFQKQSSLACRIEHQMNFSLSHETYKLFYEWDIYSFFPRSIEMGMQTFSNDWLSNKM